MLTDNGLSAMLRTEKLIELIEFFMFRRASSQKYKLIVIQAHSHALKCLMPMFMWSICSFLTKIPLNRKCNGLGGISPPVSAAKWAKSHTNPIEFNLFWYSQHEATIYSNPSVFVCTPTCWKTAQLPPN